MNALPPARTAPTRQSEAGGYRPRSLHADESDLSCNELWRFRAMFGAADQRLDRAPGAPAGAAQPAAEGGVE